MLNRLSYHIDEALSDGKIDYDTYLNLREMSDQLGDENETLRKKLEKAVELPFEVGTTVYTIHETDEEDKYRGEDYGKFEYTYFVPES